MPLQKEAILKAWDWGHDKTMKKFALYTAVFGKPARFNIPEISIPGVDRFCFTDFDITGGINQTIPIRNGNSFKNEFYHVVKMKMPKLTDPRKNRLIKICIPREIFDNYEYSVYIDCKRPFSIDFDRHLYYLNKEKGADFQTMKHKKRDCVYDEAEKCLSLGKGNWKKIHKQIAYYKKENYPDHNGLFDNSRIFRRHTKELKTFMQLWWGQLERFSHRDQISLPFLAWKYDVKISLFERKK